jgi:hypothetical protein
MLKKLINLLYKDILINFILNNRMVKNTKGGSSHKKAARKKEDSNKVVKVNLDVNFAKDNMLVFIEKNVGNCFTGKLVHYAGTTAYGEDLKIMHQRGNKGKSNFDHSHSRIALISIISGISLATKCIGIVEEFIEIDHLNAYLSNNLISQEVYDNINMKFSFTSDTKDTQEELGFIFDRSRGDEDEYEESNKNVETKTKKKDSSVVVTSEKKELNIEEI